MIDNIFALLGELELVPTGARPPVNISFLRTTLAQIFVDAKHSIVVKVAPAETDAAAAIIREHDALRMQEKFYPRLVPAPLALARRQGEVLLVLRGIMHRSAKMTDLCARHISGQSEICEFLGRTAAAGDMARGFQMRALPLECAVEALPDPLRQKIVGLSEARRWRSLEASLPPVPQHSDLAINNVGRTADGFVLFDWEDYGRVALPGFDICTLIASGCAFDPARIHAMVWPSVRGRSGATGILGQAVHRLAISPDRLADLFLVSIVLFHALKCSLGYGGAVIESSRKLLGALAGDTSWNP